jgi:hypothetical protein
MKDIKEDTKTNGKNSDAHKLEKLILWKYPYYLKQFTDSM